MYKTSLFIIIFFLFSSLINAEIIKDFKVNETKEFLKRPLESMEILN